MTTQELERPTQVRSGAPRDWTVAIALVALGAIPLIAGALRLIQLAGGPSPIATDGRLSGFPMPVVLHIVCAAIFVPLGAVQFAASVRRRFPAWHQRAGRVAFVAGIGVVISALTMTLLYSQKAGTGDLLYGMRLFFASAMGIGLLLALAAIRRRDIPTHRAWMIRAYAIGIAAGTQAFTGGISEALFGVGVLQGDLAKGAGWVINLAIAEWVIRRQPRIQRPSHRALQAPQELTG
ncbi:MAG: DUF2306 domain-containing protein [Candidatus Nanopelagicales bacterium]|nr:DUF2306 domain-containing protein [Candidatus Nanopelagicales bacterium]